MSYVSFAVPNLPGMKPDPRAWVYRLPDGFQRSATLSRPNSAASLPRPSSAGGSGLAASYQTLPGMQYTMPGQTQLLNQAPYARPSTADGTMRPNNTVGGFFPQDPIYTGELEERRPGHPPLKKLPDSTSVFVHHPHHLPAPYGAYVQGELALSRPRSAMTLRPSLNPSTSQPLQHPLSRSLPNFGQSYQAPEEGYAVPDYNNNPNIYENVGESMQFTQRPSTAGPGVRPSFNTQSTGTLLSTNEMQPLNRSTSSQPKFVSHDKKVVRVFGHFFQARIWEPNGPLGNPNIESHICRKVVFHYYLVDDTIEIFERKQVNSGIVHGMFYRRGKLCKGSDAVNGSPVTLHDLCPGNALEALGQTIYITDADSFTRDYFRTELNIILPPSLSKPADIRKDVGAQYATGLSSYFPVVKDKFGTRSTDYFTTKEILEKTNSFLKHDGRVLRFLCVEVPGLDPPYFPHLEYYQEEEEVPEYEGADDIYNKFSTERKTQQNTLRRRRIVAPASARRFTLSYYLSNRSTEVVVQRKQSGENGQSHGLPNLILKKSKLAKNWRAVQRGEPPVFYEPDDYLCGKVVDVYGRYFLLVDCDSLTRETYETSYGTTQNPVPMITEESLKIKQPVPKLGDGFLAIGSNEDSLATVYGQPKVRQDSEKRQRNQNRLLRCRGALLIDSDKNPVNASREFLITFFLEDDSIQIYEDVKRNSGIWGGNYLKRGKYIDESAPPPTDHESYPRMFCQNDIYLGNILHINGQQFQIIEMDNMSLRFCESYPDEFPFSDTFRIVGLLLLKIVDRQLQLRNLFTECDRKARGWMNQNEFVDTLNNLDLTEDLNDQEMFTLLRRFKDGDKYLYHEMCDLFSHVHLRMQEGMKNTPKRPNSSNSDLVQFMRYARSRTIQWRRTLRKEKHALNGKVTLAVLNQVFLKHGTNMTEEVLRDVYLQYRVPDKLAKPILKELELTHADKDIYQGLYQKITPKTKSGMIKSKAPLPNKHYSRTVINSDSSVASSKKTSTKSLLGSRKPSLNYVSLVRKGSRSGMTNESSAVLSETSEDITTRAEELGHSISYSEVLIDYEKFCNDIYKIDWQKQTTQK